ncbi:MAG TPA: glycosyltransferase family 4 protein [Phycisphaerae bacterium]|nr:glycosyltransferase family 4 protein [Phycisphaerae bacterium]
MRICFFGKPDSPQLRRVVNSLAERGHDLRVVYHGAGAVPGARYTPFEIPRASLSHPYRWDTRRRCYLLGFMEEHDVVSIQFLHSWGFSPEMMRMGCFVVRPWGSDITPPPGGPQPAPETLERRREMLRNATAVSVTCDSFARTVADFAGLDAATIARTPLGVDLDVFRPSYAPEDAPIVGFIKGFGHAYGAPHLVRAIPRIIRDCPSARFELVGDGPELAECRDLAEMLGVTSCIRWLPRQSAADVPAILARWSVAAIPSITESFCIAALECGAMGVPVVASRVGGLTETVVDGETGVLVPPADSAALADALIELLREESRRRDLGVNARRFVASRYDWEKCMDAWESFFRDAANGVLGSTRQTDACRRSA